MRRFSFWLCAGTLALALLGCAPDLVSTDNGVVGTVGDALAGDGTSTPTMPAASALIPNASATINGSVIGTGNYQLYDLGPGDLGDEWFVSMQQLLTSSAPFTVVLLDADYDLLMRARVSTSSSLEHTTRADTPHVYLGVMPAYGSSGGDFRFNVSVAGDTFVPPPRQQVVYVDFGPAYDVRVHRRNPISFPAFDAAVLGDSYVGHTQWIKDTIIAAMLEDYADFDVVILSSDDGPPPSGEHSTVYLGESDDRLLGLADNVDMYNTDAVQNAAVYIESFGNYAVMRLEPDEMGVMIGNVASHELGHLLGLYHTKDPTEIMDSTGSAWELATDQSFKRGPLEDTVFATGMENTPRLLEQTVGLCSKAPAGSAKLLDSAKRQRYAAIRAFAREEIRCQCGTCLNPDE